jgi:hypothetical protein
MSDYLGNLAARSLDLAPVLHPRLSSLFEPPHPNGWRGFEHSAGLETVDGEHIAETATDAPLPPRPPTGRTSESSSAPAVPRPPSDTSPQQSSILPISGGQGTRQSANLRPAQITLHPAETREGHPPDLPEPAPPPDVVPVAHPAANRPAVRRASPQTDPARRTAPPTTIQENDAISQALEVQPESLPDRIAQPAASEQIVAKPHVTLARHSARRVQEQAKPDGAMPPAPGQTEPVPPPDVAPVAHPAANRPAVRRVSPQTGSAQRTVLPTTIRENDAISQALEVQPEPLPDRMAQPAASERIVARPQVKLARQVEAALPASAEPTTPPPEPTVHVTIGRIEVRATPPPANTKREARARPPTLSLDEYLRRYGGGR